jgi:hypothetical protein
MEGRPVDLARARREAKLLLRAARAGDAAALARIGTTAPQLSDAQFAIARGLGARSWPELVREAEAREAFAAALVRGDVEAVAATLAADPGAASRPLGSREPLLYVTSSDAEHAVDCARLLLQAGADPNSSWEDDEHERESALAGAARDPRMTALLIKGGADVDDVRALRTAAGAEDAASLELLLDAGAPLRRAMALAHVAQRDRVPAARLLLDRGPEDWGERENALVWAARGEASEEMIQLLVDHGANLEASFGGSGRPYGIAVRAGRRDLADLLVALGARRRVEPLDELIGACRAGERADAMRLAAEHPQAARLLRTAEADVLVREAARGRRQVVELLLDLGVPADARGPGGATALEVTGDASVVALLVERGADRAKRAPVEKRRADEPPYDELEWAAQAAYLR